MSEGKICSSPEIISTPTPKSELVSETEIVSSLGLPPVSSFVTRLTMFVERESEI